MERRLFLGGIAALGASSVAGPFGAAGRARAQAAGLARADWDTEGREPADLAAMTAEERVHVPVLTLPSSPRLGRPFDLAVQIGVTPHESSPAHRIDWIEIRLDDRTVFAADLSPDVAYPIVRVPLVLAAPGTLVVRARCTLHGVWTTRRTLATT